LNGVFQALSNKRLPIAKPLGFDAWVCIQWCSQGWTRGRRTFERSHSSKFATKPQSVSQPRLYYDVLSVLYFNVKPLLLLRKREQCLFSG